MSSASITRSWSPLFISLVHHSNRIGKLSNSGANCSSQNIIESNEKYISIHIFCNIGVSESGRWVQFIWGLKHLHPPTMHGAINNTLNHAWDMFLFFWKRKNILNSQSFCSPLPNYNAWSKVGWHQSPRKNLGFETHFRCLSHCILMAVRVKHLTSTEPSDDLCFCLCLVDKILNHSFSIL